ncbi:MAG: nucleotidyltransferase domain-containing protein [Candidatus Omnitrophica bacterium]|nr:nucleotidyltransferase domain-containing protein [Candidatus Omnitrophota bacterium]
MKRAQGTRRTIRRIVERLREAYQPERVILFGSYAHGRPTRDSDLDLLIVKDTPTPFYQRLAEVRRLVSPLRRGYPFDPIVVTPKELQRRLAKGDQFFLEIVTKGKQVYASGS